MDSIWTKTAALPSFERLSGNIKTDVLIIGGGLAGILCAYHLAQAGVDYALAEADTLCSGITQNTTAKVTSQHGLIYDALIRRFGTEKAGLYLEANQKALQRYRDLYQNMDCGFEEQGGYFFYGSKHESLIMQPKESYDGAIPSGNSLMAWNLVRLFLLTGEETYEQDAQRQLAFLSREAAQHPIGHAMFLLALINHETSPAKVVVVPAHETGISKLPLELPLDTAMTLPEKETEAYPLKNGKTTYYICRGHSCLPPANHLHDLMNSGGNCNRGD